MLLVAALKSPCPAWTGLQDTARVTPGMTGKKHLQPVNGISRGSSGGGQSSAAMTALPGKGTRCPPGATTSVPHLELPLGIPLAGRHRRGSFRPLLPQWDREQGHGDLSACPWDPWKDHMAGANPARHTQPVLTWLSPVSLGQPCTSCPHLLKLLCFLIPAMLETTWPQAGRLQIHGAGTLLPNRQEHLILLITSQINKSQERGRTPTAGSLFLAAIQS